MLTGYYNFKGRRQQKTCVICKETFTASTFNQTVCDREPCREAKRVLYRTRQKLLKKAKVTIEA